MLLSFNKKIDKSQYTELVPNFLSLLLKYGYYQARIESTVEVKKDDKVYTYENISVKEINDILSTSNFINGDIFIKQEKKEFSWNLENILMIFILKLISLLPPNSRMIF